MLTDFRLKQLYTQHILERVKEELNPSENELKTITSRLNATNLDDMARVADAFDRFGVKVIMDCVMGE